MESDQRTKFRLVNLRTIVLVMMLALPVVIYAIAGIAAVWQVGWMGWLWWVLPAFYVTTWLVARLWPAPPSPEFQSPRAPHWTPRDRRAAEIVQQFQTQVDQISPAQLTDLHFYLNQAQALAGQIANVYFPAARDPLTSLTVPEITAAMRLVADDLEKLVLESVPGSRLLTISQWKALGKAPKWIRRVSNTALAGSILMNPLNIARYGTSRATAQQVASSLQSELLATVYLRFIRQVGFYLIEMNSGRLRGGADAYRAALESPPGAFLDPRDSGHRGSTAGSATETRPQSVEIALVGQTGSGKSSLVNQLIGKAAATVDILPETESIQRYQLQLDAPARTISLLDTPGYGQAGATVRQARQIETALQQADAVLLVMDAHLPARDADQKTLQRLADYYSHHPQLKPPPMIAVLTHVDLLPPALNWSPPRDWRSGQSPGEASIRGAVQYTAQLLGDRIADVIPVCTDDSESRRWGVEGNLIPALLAQLDEAHAVSVLSGLEQALSRDRLKTLMRQATTSGKQLVRAWLEERFDKS